MAVIEQVSRFDDEVRKLRAERHHHYNAQVTESIAQLQRRGLVDQRLDPRIASAALGSMTYRYPEMWFVEGLLDCGFDEGVDQLVLLFVNALHLAGTDHVTPSRTADVIGTAGGQPA
jgi:hypothetical protein